MTLTEVELNKKFTIKKVLDFDDKQAREQLAYYGIVAGATVRVISRTDDLVVIDINSYFTLDPDTASKIEVTN